MSGISFCIFMFCCCFISHSLFLTDSMTLTASLFPLPIHILRKATFLPNPEIEWACDQIS